MRARASLLFCLLIAIGCGDDDTPAEPVQTVTPPPEPVVPPTPTPTPPVDPNAPVDPNDPLAGLDELDDEAEITPVGAVVQPPAHGCALYEAAPQRLWATPGPTAVVSVGDDGFVFAGYARRDDQEDLWVVAVRPMGLPRPLLREPLEVPARFDRKAPPGLGAFDSGHVGVAITDGAANARFASLPLGGARSEWILLGTSADQRFAPAVGLRGGRHAVAWTEAEADQPMRVRYAAFDPTGRELARHDLTQAGMGACAPTFVDGDGPLVFLDPHAGTSALLRANLAVDPPEVSVLRPVSHVYDPAKLAAARLGARELVGYTAVGTAAATAVGLVWNEGDRQPPPDALVPSSGYGPLHVSVAQSTSRAVFAADRPRGRERDAAREVVVRLAWVEGETTRLGEPLVVRGPNDGPASFGAIARHEDGTYALAFVGEDGVYARFLRCDEGGG
ncbi:MAG: hypothetical protein R3B99_09775 [Polyangiales bacterium]